MNQDHKKRRAALESLTHIHDGTTLGVGTGSTVDFLIDELPKHAHRIEAFVSSSDRSTARLRSLGLPVTELRETAVVDLYIDGADEATKHRHLIKGGGGALTREKILAAAARKFICIADDSKLVGVLGKFPLPIEVLPVAKSYVERQMIRAGGHPVWRREFVSDNGNLIVDVHNLTITNPKELESRFNSVPGIVTVGIFAQRPADILLISDDRSVRTIA